MGAMEDIATALTRIANVMERQAGLAGTAVSGSPHQLQPPPAYQPPPQQQYTPQPPGYTNSQGITAEAITALIQPHVGNQQIKDALGATMREMGINALPDTQAHQFAELYNRFQGVIARFTQGGQQPPPQTASII